MANGSKTLKPQEGQGEEEMLAKMEGPIGVLLFSLGAILSVGAAISKNWLAVWIIVLGMGIIIGSMWINEKISNKRDKGKASD